GLPGRRPHRAPHQQSFYAAEADRALAQFRVPLQGPHRRRARNRTQTRRANRPHRKPGAARRRAFHRRRADRRRQRPPHLGRAIPPQTCRHPRPAGGNLSTTISEKLEPKLTGEDKRRLTKRYTDNTEAYQLYLKGRYFWNLKTEDGFRK